MSIAPKYQTSLETAFCLVSTIALWGCRKVINKTALAKGYLLIGATYIACSSFNRKMGDKIKGCTTIQENILGIALTTGALFLAKKTIEKKGWESVKLDNSSILSMGASAVLINLLVINFFLKKEELISIIPLNQYKNTDECSICLDRLNTRSAASIKCDQVFHDFHLNCISQALKEKDTCPNCRGNITELKTVINYLEATENSRMWINIVLKEWCQMISKNYKVIIIASLISYLSFNFFLIGYSLLPFFSSTENKNFDRASVKEKYIIYK